MIQIPSNHCLARRGKPLESFVIGHHPLLLIGGQLAQALEKARSVRMLGKLALAGLFLLLLSLQICIRWRSLRAVRPLGRGHGANQ